MRCPRRRRSISGSRRAARRAAGLDPGEAEPRPAEIVENYQQ